MVCFYFLSMFEIEKTPEPERDISGASMKASGDIPPSLHYET